MTLVYNSVRHHKRILYSTCPANKKETTKTGMKPNGIIQPKSPTPPYTSTWRRQLSREARRARVRTDPAALSFPEPTVSRALFSSDPVYAKALAPSDTLLAATSPSPFWGISSAGAGAAGVGWPSACGRGEDEPTTD